MNGTRSDTRQDRTGWKEAVSDAAIDGYWVDPRCTACGDDGQRVRSQPRVRANWVTKPKLIASGNNRRPGGPIKEQCNAT